MLQLLKIVQLQQRVNPADLRERSAETAEYAANSANAALQYVVVVVRVVATFGNHNCQRQRLKILPELERR